MGLVLAQLIAPTACRSSPAPQAGRDCRGRRLISVGDDHRHLHRCRTEHPVLARGQCDLARRAHHNRHADRLRVVQRAPVVGQQRPADRAVTATARHAKTCGPERPHRVIRRAEQRLGQQYSHHRLLAVLTAVVTMPVTTQADEVHGAVDRDHQARTRGPEVPISLSRELPPRSPCRGGRPERAVNEDFGSRCPRPASRGPRRWSPGGLTP
ncbi:MAG: hypothetical protein QOJ50_1202 [Cryptosporangiaceae bacterium]|nr:hypothetical protein [Cryptosporangiaceae bacterium]